MILWLLFFALVSTVVFFALLVANEFASSLRTPAGPNIDPDIDIGDGIVYRKQKVSPRPSPRAYDIHPTGQGDDYVYFVDKFWTVENVLRDGRIVVTTRTNKHHYLSPDDPNLRKAGLVARLRYRNRFPQLLEAA